MAIFSMSKDQYIDYFWSKVNKNGSTPDYNPSLGACWIWNGRLNKDGYGVLSVNGKHVLSHRFAFELEEKIIDTNELDHLCRVRNCVRKSHLESVPHKINFLRGMHKTAILVRENKCLNGHDLDESNVYIDPRGKRRCKSCKIEYDKQRGLKRYKSRKRGRPFGWNKVNE